MTDLSPSIPLYAVFNGHQLLAHGSLESVLLSAKRALEQDTGLSLLFFEEDSGKQVDFNLQGADAQVLARALPQKPALAPGRPKLGVVSREVTLLPRHWEWLDQQPKSVSATLRELVEEARKREPDKARARRLREATGKTMWALAGNLEYFEEASRALYAADLKRFRVLVSHWPRDIREYLAGRLKTAADIEAGK